MTVGGAASVMPAEAARQRCRGARPHPTSRSPAVSLVVHAPQQDEEQHERDDPDGRDDDGDQCGLRAPGRRLRVPRLRSGLCRVWSVFTRRRRAAGRGRGARRARRPGRQSPEATWRSGRSASRTDPSDRVCEAASALRDLGKRDRIHFRPVRGLSCLQPGKGDQPRTRNSPSIIRAQRYDFATLV